MSPPTPHTFLPAVGDAWRVEDFAICRLENGTLEVTKSKLPYGAERTDECVEVVFGKTSVQASVYEDRNGRKFAPLVDHVNSDPVVAALDALATKVSDESVLDNNIIVLLKGSFNFKGDGKTIRIDVEAPAAYDEVPESDVEGAASMIRSEVLRIIGGGGMDDYFGARKGAVVERIRVAQADEIANDPDVLSALLWSLPINLKDLNKSKVDMAVCPANTDAWFAGDLVRRGAVARWGVAESGERDTFLIEAVATAKSFFRGHGPRVVDGALWFNDDAIAVQAVADVDMRLVTLCLLRAMVRHGHTFGATERAYFWYLTHLVLEVVIKTFEFGSADFANAAMAAFLLREGYEKVFADNPRAKEFADAVLGVTDMPDDMRVAIELAVRECNRGPICEMIAGRGPETTTTGDDVAMADA